MAKPFVVVVVASSADGRISSGPNKTMWEDMADPDGSDGVGGEVWRKVEAEVKALHSPQADMLGSNSLAKRGSPLRPLPPPEGEAAHLWTDFLPDEVVANPDRKGWLVVVDGQGRLRSGFKGDPATGWHMLHLVSAGVPAEYLAFLRQERIPYLVTGETQVALAGALEKLYSLLDVRCVLTTAGGRLGGALMAAGLVDEVNLVIRPVITGGLETPSLFDSPDGGRPARLELLHVRQEAAGHLWARYRVVGE